MNTNIATLTLKNMAAAHRQLQNNMGDAFTTTLSSFRNYLKTTALWFAKDSEGRWVEYGTCDANGIAWTAETLFAYGYKEVMKVFKNADKTVFLQNIVPVETTTATENDKPLVFNTGYKVRINAGVNQLTAMDVDSLAQAIDSFEQQGFGFGFNIKHTRTYKINGQDFWAIYSHSDKTAMDLTGYIIRRQGNTWFLDAHNLSDLRYVIGEVDMYYFDETVAPAAELKETTPAMETTVAPATPAVETVTDKDPTEDLEYAKAHMEYNFCLIGNLVAYQNAIANQIATEYTAPPVLVKPVIGGFNTQYYSFIKHEVELTGAYEVQVGYKDPKRGVARCLFPVTSMDSDRLAVIEMLLHGLFNGLDTLHYQLRKYRVVLNPLANDGMGIAQATDYGGKVHRVPFIITFNGLPVSEIAFSEYRDYLSRNW